MEDAMSVVLKAMSLEDLVALARAKDIHIEDENDRDLIEGLLQASEIVDQAPSVAELSAAQPGPASASTVTGASGAGGVGPGGDALPPPPRHDSPMSFGSPLLSPPDTPSYHNLLSTGEMGSGRGGAGMRDDVSSVGADAGTDTGSTMGGGEATAFGRGEGGRGGQDDSDRSGSGGEGFDDELEEALSSAGGVFDGVGDVDTGGEGKDNTGDRGRVTGGSGAAGGGSAERQESIDTFMSVTQETRSKAKQYLKATDWSLPDAINLFMESGGDSAAMSSASASSGADNGAVAGARGAARSSAGNDPLSPLRGVGASEAGGGAQTWASGVGVGSDEGDEDAAMGMLESMASLQGLPGLLHPGSGSGAPSATDNATTASAAAAAARARRSSAASTDARRASTNDDDDQRYPGGFSADGVRAPIPTMRDRLIGGSGSHHGMDLGGGITLGGIMGGMMGGGGGAAGGGGGGGGREEKDNTDWIFNIPEGLSFPSDFLETRQICKEQKKWFMVNIQDHEDFASHRLNKDVWSNETILTLLRGNFIFWQRNKTLRHARYYMDKYNLEGQVLPHTAILDPRTGAQLLKVEGFVEPEDLSMALVEFLENNSIDQVKAPKLKTIRMGNIAHPGYDETPAKRSQGSDKASPDESIGGMGGSSFRRDSAYDESFGSEEYVYEDEDDDDNDDGDDDGGGGDVTQGSSIEGDDMSSNTSTTAIPSLSNASPSPLNSPTPAQRHQQPLRLPGSPEQRAGGSGGGAEDRSARAAVASAVAAVGASELRGPWGRGSQDDELRFATAAGRRDTQGDDDGDEGQGKGAVEELPPQEPDRGDGVTQVQFRLPAGGPPITRRFWLKDRVSLLFQFVRTTVQDASDRQFDLLSGRPPTSLSTVKASTLEAANLQNTAILVRWL